MYDRIDKRLANDDDLIDNKLVNDDFEISTISATRTLLRYIQ